jgi:hypothetical protein
MKRLPLLTLTIIAIIHIIISLIFISIFWLLGAEKPFKKYFEFMDDIIFNSPKN